MNKITTEADWTESSRSVWRFSIEKITADCVLDLKYEALDELGIVANVGNSKKFEYF